MTQPAPEVAPFATIVINASPSEVWKVLVDVKNWKSIISGIDNIVITSAGNKDKLEPGLAWDETRVMFGRSETEHIEIVEVVDDAGEYVMKSKSESCGTLMEFEHRVRATEQDGSAGESRKALSTFEVYYSSKALTWTAWAFAWVGWLTRGMTRKVILQDMHDIKAAVEQARER